MSQRRTNFKLNNNDNNNNNNKRVYFRQQNTEYKGP